MDSMENQFGIKIHLEDFMEVRTIADIVEKLRELLGESSGLPSSPRQQKTEPDSGDAAASADVSGERTEPIRRIVFQESELKLSEARPISLSAEDTVLVLTASRQDALSVKVVDVLQQKYGVATKIVEYVLSPASGSESDKAGGSFNKRLQETAAATDRLAGVMIVLSNDLTKAIPDPAEASRILTEFFSVAKVFIDSPDKKFAFCMYEHEDSSDIVRLVAQGTLGMFLSLGHEFSSIQFRVIGVGSSTDLGAAIEHGLDRGQKVIETFHRQERLYTTVGIPERLSVTDEGTFSPRPEDVVLLSGGARGITYHLARKLADFGCKLVFLGTTPIDPSIDYKKLLNEGISTPEVLADEIRRRKPGLSEESIRTEQVALAKALEIISNVETLRASGVEASYYRCDVTDRDQTNHVITEILRRYNGIQGVVHGAGVLKDNFAKQMSVEDFRLVTDVKFLGALNLLKATEGSGLRFFVCLSSGAAIQGNPGQANYSTGNRMMS
jgi:NAD(P)-dependent dehydrogenase (short-subunit alcohol dehydrogenase family)